jgi:hypothetical protein
MEGKRAPVSHDEIVFTEQRSASANFSAVIFLDFLRFLILRPVALGSKEKL